MHNSNYRADQYRDIRRRLNEMNTPSPVCNSGMNNMGMSSVGCARSEKPCNPEGDKSNGWGLYEYPLAMVYSPYQTFRNVYKCNDALEKGTLFSELYLPFEGCK